MHKSTKYDLKVIGKGVYVIPFSFPVVPKGKARIRTQVSVAHSIEDFNLRLKNLPKQKLKSASDFDKINIHQK